MNQHVAHRASDEVAQGNGIAALSRELFDTMRFAAARGMNTSDLRAASDIATARMFGRIEREGDYYDKAPGI